jgi:hypothetical protein
VPDTRTKLVIVGGRVAAAAEDVMDHRRNPTAAVSSPHSATVALFTRKGRAMATIGKSTWDTARTALRSSAGTLTHTATTQMTPATNSGQETGIP